MEDAPMSVPSKMYKTGLILAIISFFIYLIPTYFFARNNNEMEAFGFFVLNYAIALFYLIWMIMKKQWRNTPIVLMLFLISCWTLNLSLPIFEANVVWFSALMVLCGANYLLIPKFTDRSHKVRHVLSFLLGVSFLVFLYLAIYLGPGYLFGLVASFVVGISLHTLVPLLIAAWTLKKAIYISRLGKGYVWSFLAGIAIPLVCIVVFVIQWSSVNSYVNAQFRNNLIADNTDMPGWIKIARSIPDNAMTDKYLKADLVYTMPSGSDFGFRWGLPERNFEEDRRHDPLVMIAAFLVDRPSISKEDRISILEAMYISGHKAQERLWSGKELKTTSVITNARIWPQQRLAYTEKILTIRNTKDASRNSWNSGEAIYTFHLPEGGVVTSLSLWVDGKERKGILTTRHKADSAYKQIVGQERRDPSVVHWQEGNTVSVRVFPVMPRDERIFKLGITAPLTLNNGMLSYDNIWFEGPGSYGAPETRQIDWINEPEGLTMPSGFKTNKAHRYISEGKYLPEWSIEFRDPGFQSQSFSFTGNTYSLQPYVRERSAAVFNTVYLDLNRSWSKAELEQVVSLFSDKEIYAGNESLFSIKGTGGVNQEAVGKLLHQHFSIFPFHLVTDPATSIVISKSTHYAPSLKDIKGSDFGDSLAAHLKVLPMIKLFNIGSEVSPYLRTLKEHRIFTFEQGSIADLKKLVSDRMFAHSIESDEQVTIDNAMLMLKKTSGATTGNGPDHLMRLFAYNHVMSRMKGDLFPENIPDSSLIAEAEQAYVVSPVSSLVVLETQADYDRFGIKMSDDALGNASLKSNGAVPEPHEWALILLAVGTMVYIIYRNKLKRASGA